jgi:TatA/E family protein of Tat protein translocase
MGPQREPEMPGLFGHWYILVLILVIVLIVYGPGKLPEVGGAIGKAMREFRKTSSDIQEEFKKSAPTDSSAPTGTTGGPTPDVKPATDVKSPTATDLKSPTDTKA